MSLTKEITVSYVWMCDCCGKRETWGPWRVPVGAEHPYPKVPEGWKAGAGHAVCPLHLTAGEGEVIPWPAWAPAPDWAEWEEGKLAVALDGLAEAAIAEDDRGETIDMRDVAAKLGVDLAR